MSTSDRLRQAPAPGEGRHPSKWLAPLAVALLLGGCATGAALDERHAGGAGEESLRLVRAAPHTAEVSYAGRRFVGPWTEEPCRVDSCGDVYLATPRLHWRNLSKGHAVLTAADGSRLECDWISRRNEVDGTCRTGDGRAIRLRGEGADGAD